MNAPDEITLADLECVVMPNGEVICLGKTLGWVGDFGGRLRPHEVDQGPKSEIKVIGVHDECTYKPMVILRIAPANERERRILGRAGFGLSTEEQAAYAFSYDLNRGECTYDPFKLSDQRTCGEAARWIRGECGFDMLPHGAFLDCEFLRGEKKAPMAFEDEFDNYWK